MKSLKNYIYESNSGFNTTVNISMNQFNSWKKKADKNYSELQILYSEADRVYAIYLMIDKSSIKWNGKHIGSYNCLTGEFHYDKNQKYFDDVIK